MPRGSLGHGPAEGPLPAPGAQRQQGKKGGRKRRVAAISCPPPARACGSALNLKIKLVFGREERTRPGEPAARGLQAGEMLRHGANMDAGLLSFVA